MVKTYIRLIFRTLLATIWENFYSPPPPLEKIIGQSLRQHCQQCDLPFNRSDVAW